MTNKQLTVLITVVTLAVVGLAFGLTKLAPQTVKEVIKEKTLGSVTGPDVTSPYFSVDGVKNQYASRPAAPYASTTCSYRVLATSTIAHASFSANQMASSTLVEIGVGASAFATTTRLALLTTPTGGGAVVSSTTGQVVVPGQFVNVKVGQNGSGDALPKINGVCKVVLTEI